MNCRHHHHHRLHHQAWPHPVDGPPHHHLRAWPHLHLLLADGKESLPHGGNTWHNDDSRLTYFSPELCRVDDGDDNDNVDDEDYDQFDKFLTTVGSGWVGQREGREQDFHCQGTDGASRRECSIEEKMGQNIHQAVARTY